MFGEQTNVWRPNILLFGHLVWFCLIVFCLLDKICRHQTNDQKLKTFLLFSCLMGDILLVTHQTCLMRACVLRLLSGLYQLFDLCFNRSATHFNIGIFGHQAFPVCTGLNAFRQLHFLGENLEATMNADKRLGIRLIGYCKICNYSL